MDKKDIQAVEINVRFINEGGFMLRQGDVVDRDERPECFEMLTRTLDNVGDEENSMIKVAKKVGKKDEDEGKEKSKPKKKEKSKPKKKEKSEDKKEPKKKEKSEDKKEPKKKEKSKKSD